jgi:hypothetical protein
MKARSPGSAPTIAAFVKLAMTRIMLKRLTRAILFMNPNFLDRP